MHECHKEDFLNMLKEDVGEIKKDVKSLLKSKYQFLGFMAGISAFLSVVFTLLAKIVL